MGGGENEAYSKRHHDKFRRRRESETDDYVWNYLAIQNKNSTTCTKSPRMPHVLAEIPFVRLFPPAWKESDNVAYTHPLPKCDTDPGLTTEYTVAFCFNTQVSQCAAGTRSLRGT